MVTARRGIIDVASVRRAAGRDARVPPGSGKPPRSSRRAESTAAFTTAWISSRGQQIGRSVAEFVAANFMKPGRGWDD